MATVRLSDVVVPEVYADYQTVNSPEKTAFVESGIVVSNPMLTEKAGSGGKILDVPFWNDLDASAEPNISNDDPSSTATPDKVGTGTQIARLAYLNNGWSSTDLAGEIAGSSPMERIASRTGRYWQKQWQKRILSTCNGVLADNVANDSGDMVYDVAIEDGSAATSSNVYSREAFTSAAFTLGDAFDGVTGLAVHSVVYKRMVDNDDIEFIKDSAGSMMIPTFMGRRVIIDDAMPVTSGAISGFKYTSVLFGAGALGYGLGNPDMPVEIEREASQGNGSGVETLWERNTWLIHPFGYQFTSASVAGESATLTELETATNWDRVVERKNVPLAFLITNG